MHVSIILICGVIQRASDDSACRLDYYHTMYLVSRIITYITSYIRTYIMYTLN